MNLSLESLKNNAIQENSSIYFNNCINIVHELKDGIATLFDGKKFYDTKLPQNLEAKRLVLATSVPMVGKSIEFDKPVNTDINFKHFEPLLYLASNGLPVVGNTERIYKTIRRGDPVRVSMDLLVRKFPDAKASELKDSIGIVTRVEKNIFHVMILNTTIETKRSDLINKRSKNTKFLYTLTADVVANANAAIDELYDEYLNENYPTNNESLSKAECKPPMVIDESIETESIPTDGCLSEPCIEEVVIEEKPKAKAKPKPGFAKK